MWTLDEGAFCFGLVTEIEGNYGHYDFYYSQNEFEFNFYTIDFSCWEEKYRSGRLEYIGEL